VTASTSSPGFVTLSRIADTVRETGGELRAGSTDVSARHRGGISDGPFVDLHGVPDLHGIDWRDGSAVIGTLTTVAEVAADPGLRDQYPALAMTAGALATPQIRAVGTLGGNLLQRNRCWYFRNPQFTCFQTGGDSCPARAGLSLYGTVIDQSSCVAPHPSSIAMALIGYGATADVHGRDAMAVRDLYDGSDHARDHVLQPGEVLTAIRMPAPLPGERSAYRRAISRFEAEWPLVEAIARVSMDGPVITFASVAVGGVARTPLHLPEVAELLVGRVATAEILTAAADATLDRCVVAAGTEQSEIRHNQTEYKKYLLRNTVLDVLERAVDGGA
jgi:xanthine dehydrogenase YagS FAD-binding subunit